MIKKDAEKIRHEYLKSLVVEVDLEENNKFSHYNRRLIVIEQQVVIHKRIKKFTISTERNSIAKITVPKDPVIE